MKKLLSIFSIVALTLILVFPADASIDARERPNGASFHIKNVVDYAQAYGIRGNDNVTRIPVCLEIGNDVSTDLIVSIESKLNNAQASSGVLNFTVSGSFYRTSDGEIVSVYGLSGSFEYDGNDTEITGKDSYHRPTLTDWSGTSKTSTDKVEPYNISILKGDYVLYYKNKENNTAWIKIAVSESGMYSVGGDYVSYEVN